MQSFIFVSVKDNYTGTITPPQMLDNELSAIRSFVLQVKNNPNMPASDLELMYVGDFDTQNGLNSIKPRVLISGSRALNFINEGKVNDDGTFDRSILEEDLY